MDLSSDGDMARALLDASDMTEYEARKLDRDRLIQYDANKSIDLEYADSVLDLRFNMDKAFKGDLDLSFDLDDLPGLGPILSNDAFGLDLTSEGKVHVDADLNFNLNFTFDLSSLGDPKFIIYDDSFIEFRKLKIETLEPIDIKGSFVIAGQEVLSMSIADAMIFVDLVGTVSLVADSDDHQYFVSELAANAALWNVDLIGSIEADLPMYFPTSSIPFGGSDRDADNDGVPDNVLHVDGVFRGENDYDLNFAVPKFDLSAAFNIFALLNDPAIVLSSLEAMFGELGKQVAATIASLELPLIGDGLDGADQFIDDMRISLLGAPAGPAGEYWTTTSRPTDASGYIDSLGGFLQKAIDDDDTVFESIINLLKAEIYENLGDLLQVPVTVGGNPLMHENGTPEDATDDVPYYFNPETGAEVFLLVGGKRALMVESATVQIAMDPNTGTEQYSVDEFLIYRDVIVVDDIQLRLTDGALGFNLLMAGSVLDIDVPLDFATAFPGFALESDATIQLRLDYILSLGFGFSAADGFFMDTSGATERGEELVLALSVTFEADDSIEATLGFLKAELTSLPKSLNPAVADDDGRESGLFGRFSVDIKDEGGDGAWTIFNPLATKKTEKVEVVVQFIAEADVDLYAKLSADTGASGISLPELTTVIHYEQVFANVTLSTSGGNNFDFGGSATIILEDVTLDLGKVLAGFLGPVVEAIAPYIGSGSAIREIIDILTMEIDLGITKLRLLDLAQLVMSPSTFKKTEKAIEAIKEFSDFVTLVDEAISAPPGQPVLINFGTFTLGGASLSDANAPASEDSLPATAPDVGAMAQGKQKMVTDMLSKTGKKKGSI
ncbi:MAG: hypothetical protein ACKVH7_11205, partial [Alphaproteobacteria bacterium]